MLEKVEAGFIFAIVAGLAIIIWANIAKNYKQQQPAAKKPCSCGGQGSVSAGNTGTVDLLDNQF